MSALLDAVAHPAAVWAGWTALIVLWQSLVVALALAAWRAARVSASAEVQHRAALAALALCVAGLVATPVVLASWPAQGGVAARPRVVAVGGARTVVPSAGVLPTAPPTAASIAPAPPSLNVIAGAAGLVWLAGSAVLLVRLAGGWWMAGRVRARAVRVSDGEVLEALRGMPGNLQPLCGVDVLESSEVEAPVVIGARRPALIVPNDLGEQLGPAALAPLLAHECAHVRRADYAANVAQSAAEALLFFSPAVRWISRVVRETREYCCDDIAIDWCGEDRGGYVRALTGLASLGSRNRMQPALGAAGPRLITRVRRLLSEENMARPAVARFAATFVVSAAVAAAGWPVLGLSASSVARASASSAAQESAGAGSAAGARRGPIPIGYPMRQPGSSVTLSIEADATYAAATATLRNVADVAVTSVTIAAFVSGQDLKGPIAGRSTKIDVLVQPSTSETVALHLLDLAQLAEMKPTIGEPRQAYVGLVSVRFANGAEWTTTPNPNGRTLEQIFSLAPAEVARQLVGVSTPGSSLCYDQDRNAYSPGAIVPVRDEPGRFVACRKGVWRDEPGVGLSAAPDGMAPAVAQGEKTVDMDLADASLDDILSSLGAVTGFTIRRAPDVPNKVGLSARFQRAKIEDALDMIVGAQGLTYRSGGPGVIIVELAKAPAAETMPQPGNTTTPRALKQVSPAYPSGMLQSLKQNASPPPPQGTVLVEVVIGIDGKVKNTKVKKSLSPELDAEALKAARQWEFKPGTKDGVPVEVTTEIEFTFTTVK